MSALKMCIFSNIVMKWHYFCCGLGHTVCMCGSANKWGKGFVFSGKMWWQFFSCYKVCSKYHPRSTTKPKYTLLQRLVYKGLQRLVNSFQSNLIFARSTLRDQNAAMPEWVAGVARIFYQIPKQVVLKGKTWTKKPWCRPSNEPVEEQSILWVQYSGDSGLGNNGTLRLSQKKKLFNDYVRFIPFHLESVRWLTWIA